MKRVLTALLLIPPVWFLVFKGPAWALAIAVALVAAACFREYLRIATAHGTPLPMVVGYAAGLVLLLSPLNGYLVVTLLVMAAMALALQNDDLRLALPQAAALMLGVIYVFGTWRFAIHLRQVSPHWLFFGLGLNWIADISAMAVGKWIGRRRLAPIASPKKTWEGAIASVAASVAAALIYLGYFVPETTLWERALLAAAGNVAGQFGDISESALKRGAGMKDSGAGLPGHGGWLDRVDSTMFSLPVIYGLLLLLGRA